jgi:hypothetical protein
MFPRLDHVGPHLHALRPLVRQRAPHTAWDRMDNIIMLWTYDTISLELLDVTRQRDHMTPDTWLASDRR